MINYQQLLEQIHEYVTNYYRTHKLDTLVYHNLQHTTTVAGRVTQIANHYQINDDDFFIVSAAAWFHDLGYMTNLQNHEEQSATIAEEFLTSHNVDDISIQTVKNCIMATRVPQAPNTLLEKIICDADLFHLGTDDFFENDKIMRKEKTALLHIDISKLEWRKKTVSFLEQHHYHTDYCQLLLNGTKQKNIEELKRKIAKAEEPGTADDTTPDNQIIAATEPNISNKKKDKEDRPEKGIETMFRISSGNHQRLSDMADNKAHIMITVNSIILSAIISLLLRRLSEYEYLIIPTFILLSVSLLAMTFAILSTRPSLPHGTFSKSDVESKRVNLLFFGNYYRMSLEDYTYGMQKMMGDREFLYGSLIRDVYGQGVVLGKKYRLLRVAYNVFMFGLIISVLAFIVASALFNTKA